MGKQCTVKCFYTSRLISVIYGVGSDFGGTRSSCFLARFYCSRGISFNIKRQNSHFDISQQLLSPDPLRKTFTLQTSLSLSLFLSLASALSPSLSNSAFVSFLFCRVNKHHFEWFFTIHPSASEERRSPPRCARQRGPFNRSLLPCGVQGPRSSTQSSLLFICQSPELEK